MKLTATPLFCGNDVSPTFQELCNNKPVSFGQQKYATFPPWTAFLHSIYHGLFTVSTVSFAHIQGSISSNFPARWVFQVDTFHAPKCSQGIQGLAGQLRGFLNLVAGKKIRHKKAPVDMDKTSPNPAGFLVYQLVIPGYFGGFLHTFRDAPILMTLVLETWMVCCLYDVVVPSSWICENKHTRIFQWVLNGW